ncbi:MAG: PAS domain-containing sensor histidine kinase [Actinobacteria bacterium]|nr:PAS domain-containing sensor histidine kinase [Actinomycetota bacterium]
MALDRTDLDTRAIGHLQRLMGSWGILADLSFADLVLLVPVRGTANKRLLVLGQIRPSTSQTVIPDDLVGDEVEGEGWDAAVEALGAGSLCECSLRLPRGDEDVYAQMIPVRFRGSPIAVLARVLPLASRPSEDGGDSGTSRLLRSVALGRREGRLERVYQDLSEKLIAMVADGVFPFPIEDVPVEEAPRVGDGLVVVDRFGRASYASPNAVNALHRLGVYSDITGKRLSELGVEDAAVQRSLNAGLPVIEEVERKRGVIVLLHCIPLISHHEVTGALVLLRDVTDLRRLGRLLLSKDAAIREVHHRVKNNLQTISSLLSLQARRLSPGEGKEALREAERRVRSIALVHEILSRDPGEQVPFDEIVASLVKMAEDSIVSSDAIAIRVHGTAGELDADIATPLALVVAELIQNAIEHAFPVRNGHDASGTGTGNQDIQGSSSSHDADEALAARDFIGHVDVLLDREDDTLILLVEDDGIGLPPDFDIATSKSLGLSIVRDLVSSQLGGKIEMCSKQEHASGTKVRISVPLEHEAFS